MTEKKKHWIQNAVQKSGSFLAEAKHAGKSTAAYAQENEDAPGILGRRARLAATLMGLRKKVSNG